MLEETTLREIFNRITHEYSKCRIYLFGSYAYGNPQPGSDLDIAVILGEVSSKVKESVKLYDLLEDIPYPKDIVVSSEKEFDHFSRQAGSVFRTIAEKGVLLHG